MKPTASAEDLRALRKKHRLNQMAMATLCGVAPRTYQKWEAPASPERPPWAAYWIAKIRLEGAEALAELEALHPTEIKGVGVAEKPSAAAKARRSKITTP